MALAVLPPTQITKTSELPAKSVPIKSREFRSVEVGEFPLLEVVPEVSHIEALIALVVLTDSVLLVLTQYSTELLVFAVHDGVYVPVITGFCLNL